jgi:protein tyrosine/serine phosphatase
MLKKVDKIVVALLIVGMLVFPGVAAEKAALPRNDIPGLSNFAKVSDDVYRGAQPEPAGFAELKKMGIKTIVNLRANHSDEQWLKGLGFHYINIPMEANNIGDKQAVAFLKVITDPKYKPYFVHCQHGADRTGTMIALYRMYVQEWPRQKALGELSTYKFHEYFFNLRRYLKKVDLQILGQKVKTAPEPVFEYIQ